ncbi:hypothetical protein [Bradyrhizobium sp. CIR3A]|uniref:hypothetical protein n=1 Tax=Bradyrhizobium sp. CIR3A TaxID=2663838 RepID=UPI0016067A61|nr:hypothetical protein [Bradyrhizobium sp. CIR3A]MBB4257301.1 hypothetical protein [Bradyrhizobium sp. CIR3A]
MAGEDKMAGLQQAFATLAAEQVRAMSDEDLARHAQAVVAMLEAVQAEYDRRNAVRLAGSDMEPKAIGRA